MKTFTVEFMKNNCGCYSQDELMACSFMKSEQITLESILKSEIPLKDKFWFYCKKVANKEQNQEIAIDVAEMVLPLFERKYPNDSRPREAIKAAKEYLAGGISLGKLMEKRRNAYAAADDAYAAADDADDAYAAAYAAAAAAADDADDADAADAYAAAYAAAAADDADDADAADIKQKLEQYLCSLIN